MKKIQTMSLIMISTLCSHTVYAKNISQSDQKIAFDNLRKELGKVKEVIDYDNKRTLCANTQIESYTMCLTPKSVHTIKNNSGVYKYIVYGGMNEETSHANSGAIAFYILKKRGNKYEITAKSDAIFSGTYGRPSIYDFKKLGKNIYGWVGTEGTCRGMGCELFLKVMLPHKTKKTVNTVLDSMMSDYDKYKIKRSNKARIYPINVEGTLCRFDMKSWKYVGKKKYDCSE